MSARRRSKVRKVLLNGNPRFRVDLGMIEGKRVVRHFTAKGDAEGYLQDALKVLRHQGTMGFQLSDHQKNEAAVAWQILEKNGSRATLLDVVNFFIRYGQPSGGEQTVEEALAELLESKRKSGKRESYVKALGWTLGRFCRRFGRKKVNLILAKEVERWLDDEGVRAVNRRNYIRDVNLLFNYCVKRKYCVENPIAEIEKPIIEEKPVEILTVEQCRTLLNTASKPEYREILPSIAIGLFAGLRAIEIRRLEWPEVDVPRRIIEIKAAKAKTRQRRIVDMSENLAAWLDCAIRSSNFVAPQGEKWREKFSALADEANLRPWPRNALRHSFGSYHLALSKDPSKTAFQMGHSDTQMLFRHYRELVSPEDAKSYWSLLPSQQIVDTPELATI